MQRPPLTLDEIGLLERAAGPRERLLLLTLYETGCTVSELVALTPQDISFPKRAVRAGGRVVPVSVHLLGLLRQAASPAQSAAAPSRSAPPFLFSSRESGAMTPRRVEQLLAGLGRRALTRPVTPHQLRLTRIVHDFLNRVPLGEIERKLGLKSIQPHLYAYFRLQAAATAGRPPR